MVHGDNALDWYCKVTAVTGWPTKDSDWQVGTVRELVSARALSARWADVYIPGDFLLGPPQPLFGETPTGYVFPGTQQIPRRVRS